MKKLNIFQKIAGAAAVFALLLVMAFQLETTQASGAVQGKAKIVSLGTYHSGKVMEDGSLYMWGRNNYGQLGDGTKKDRTEPVKVLDHVVSLSLGKYHSAAVTKKGNLYVWGYGASGQIGDGTLKTRKNPRRILRNVASVSLGENFGAAITKNGTLYMWGNNKYGQLGNGTTTRSLKPVKIMKHVQSVSLGKSHSGAVAKDGSLYMWGNNTYGQLGDGTTTQRLEPVKVKKLENVKSISLGAEHSGAVMEVKVQVKGKKKNAQRLLYMWGRNQYGQLGDGTTKNRKKPTQVLSGNKISTLSLGEGHSAAVTTNGKLFAWGRNSSGEVSISAGADRLNPVKIRSSEKIADTQGSISMGGKHSGAITQSGDLYLWGSNVYGQAGQ